MFPQLKPAKKLIYLDNAATTPLNEAVKLKMSPFWINNFGNPSSLYKQGREAKQALEDARKKIAGLINARPNEVIFTAGGTESINLAVFGVAGKYQNQKNNPAHIITTTIEHHAVLKSFQALQGQNVKTNYVGVDKFG